MAGSSTDGGNSSNSGSRNVLAFNLSDKAWAAILAAAIGIGSTTAVIKKDAGTDFKALDRRIDAGDQESALNRERLEGLRRDLQRIESQIEALARRMER